VVSGLPWFAGGLRFIWVSWWSPKCIQENLQKLQDQYFYRADAIPHVKLQVTTKFLKQKLVNTQIFYSMNQNVIMLLEIFTEPLATSKPQERC